MTVPLSRKVAGKKFVWDGAINENQEQARQKMESYEKNGFEVQMFEEDGQYLVYSRRVPAVQTAE